MRRWTVAIGWLMLAVVVAACSKKRSAPAAKPAPPEPDRPTTPTPGMKAAAMPGPGAMLMVSKPAMAPKAVAPTPPPARQMPRSALKATVRKPSWAVRNRHAGRDGNDGVHAWNVVALGGAKFAYVVSGREKGSTRFWFRLVVVEKVDDKWTRRHYVPIASPADSHYEADMERRWGASLRIRDLDWDGKPEAEIRYRYPVKEGEKRWLAIVNLGGAKPTIALSVQLADLSPELESYKGHFRHKDVNGDKHPDVVVVTIGGTLRSDRRTGAGYAGKRATTTQYIWDWKTDTYRKSASKEVSYDGD